jgi:hypothetical protein
MVTDIDTARSYATEARLNRALTKIGLAEARPIIVRNRAGRWTAVFGWNLSGIGAPMVIAHAGFKVIN